MDLGIEGKVALVTGASKGIGQAIARELEAEGCIVAASSRSTERFAWDSADADGAQRLVAEVAEALGPVDILVVNTGGPPAGMPLEFTREQWEAAYRSLVLGPMALVEAALPGMRERGWGRIVNVVSTSVREPIPPLMLSNAHRSAMVAAFKTIAREVAADGV